MWPCEMVAADKRQNDRSRQDWELLVCLVLSGRVSRAPVHSRCGTARCARGFNPRSLEAGLSDGLVLRAVRNKLPREALARLRQTLAAALPGART